MRIGLLCGWMLILGSPLLARAQTSAPPRLIVAISVDQFSADLFAEYRAAFSAGLKRLQIGAVFPSGYQSHAATETCPGHSTILTGTYPYRSGIVANEWVDGTVSRSDKQVYCAEDASAAGSSSAHYTPSVRNLRVPTLGDRMKSATPKSRVVSVAGKDRAALMLGGHHTDQVWFWNGKDFATVAGAPSPAPEIVGKINAAVADTLAHPAAYPLPAVCQHRAEPLALPGKTIGLPQDPRPGDPNALRVSLAFDRLITDLALGLLQELKLGQGPQTDLLAIGLSATDYVGHTFGTQGAEMCAQLMGVDANVGRILDALDALHLPYAVVLTADHGAEDLPERSRAAGMGDAMRVDPALLPENMNKAIEADVHIGQALLPGSPSGDIYVAKNLGPEARLRVIEAARKRYAAHPQVAAVFVTAELARRPLPQGAPDEWSLADRFRIGIDLERSGDLLVALKPHITPLPTSQGAVVTHGSPWNYDRRVPILFFRPGMRGLEQPLPVQTVDIMPTLASLIGLTVPAGEIDGHCLGIEQLGSRCPK